MINREFVFKRFSILQDRCAMKVGTDGVLLGAWAEGGKHILDIGTGTGLIALMMAQRFDEAQIDAIDIVSAACNQAQENVRRSVFGDRISIENSPLQSFRPRAGLYDAIVCNPPFFVDSLKSPDPARNTARHADSLPFDQLAKCASALLSADGKFSLVLPSASAEAFTFEATVSGLYLGRLIEVSTVSGKPSSRVLMTFYKRRPEALERYTEHLMETDGSRSSWFADLTKDFYLS